MTTSRILLAEDDLATQRLAQMALEKAGFQLFLAGDGPQALEVWRRQPVELIILDVMMPGLDGFDVSRTIRRVSDAPILMLTALQTEADILHGFESGADDYLVKPFRASELAARVRAILQRMQRSTPLGGARLAAGDLVLDLVGQWLTRGGQTVSATPLDFQLLQYLMQRPGQAVSKEELFHAVWGYAMPAGGMNLIEVAVRRLREKIEPDPSRPQYVQTVRGTGYRFGD